MTLRPPRLCQTYGGLAAGGIQTLHAAWIRTAPRASLTPPVMRLAPEVWRRRGKIQRALATSSSTQRSPSCRVLALWAPARRHAATTDRAWPQLSLHPLAWPQHSPDRARRSSPPDTRCPLRSPPRRVHHDVRSARRHPSVMRAWWAGAPAQCGNQRDSFLLDPRVAWSRSYPLRSHPSLPAE